jgi:DNA primase
VADFRRGIDHAAAAGGGGFEAAMLPTDEKERLCKSLLQEFGARNVRHGADGELIHSCVLPFGLHKHGDSHPSASLNYKKLVYNCQGCENAGGLLWFIGVCRGVEGPEARQWLNKQTGIGEEQDLSVLLAYFDEVYAKRPEVVPIPKLSERVLEPWMFIHPYMTEIRGIPEETLVNFKVGYGNLLVPKDDTRVYSERIVIPHFWQGDLVGWQSRRLLDDGTAKYISSPDFPKYVTLYNHDPKARPIAVVVESPMSVLSKCHVGANMVATFGAKVTDRQCRLLGLHRAILLWFDNDDAGWRATRRVGEFCSPYTQVLVVNSPYAADPADLDDATFVDLVDDTTPYHLWEQPKELVEMGLTKHGAGEILPEDGDNQKTAAANWTEEDQEELAEELAEDDR